MRTPTQSRNRRNGTGTTCKKCASSQVRQTTLNARAGEARSGHLAVTARTLRGIDPVVNEGFQRRRSDGLLLTPSVNTFRVGQFSKGPTAVVSSAGVLCHFPKADVA